MANNKSTTDNKRDIKRVPLLLMYHARGTDASEDQVLQNCYVEVVENPQTEGKSYFVRKRPGLVLVDTLVTTGAMEGRSLFYWEETDDLYAVVDNTLYRDGSPIHTLTSTTGAVYAEKTGPKSNEKVLFNDGQTIKLLTTTDAVTTVTVPWSTDIAAGIAYLDGYNFIGLQAGGLYNSDLLDPTTWDSLSFLSAEMFPDKIQRTARHINNVMCLGSESLEFFYNAANTSASPLAKYSNANSQIGTLAPKSFASMENAFVYIGHSKEGGHDVYVVGEPFGDAYRPKSLSTSSIRRLLEAEGSNIVNAQGYCFRWSGQKFYLMTLTGANRSFLVDLETKLWSEWTWYNGTSYERFPAAGVADKNGEVFILHRNNGKLYKLSNTAYQDNGATIKVLLRTGKFDLNTQMRKAIYRTCVIGDETDTTSTIYVRWSDDDYNTWSTEVSGDLQKRVCFNRCGATRRRAFEIRHEANTPLRLEALEFLYKMREG